MVRASPALVEFEAAYQREAFRGLSYVDALRRFADLWAEARALNADVGHAWLEDLAPDLAMARALNGLPPTA